MEGKPDPRYELARQAWPGVELSREIFAARLAALPIEVAEASAVLPDFYLAWACSSGAPAALAAFERSVLCQVPTFVRRFRRDAAFADEVGQRLRERLLVGATPRISAYGGRGSLVAWVRVAALRIAIDLLRGAEAASAPPTEVVDDGLDPALRLLKARYRDDFQRALEHAVAALTARQRNLLRMHHVDGYSLDRLATIHGVHRATVARWLADARSAIVTGVQTDLGARLALSPSEVDSLATLINSQLHLTLGRSTG